MKPFRLMQVVLFSALIAACSSGASGALPTETSVAQGIQMSLGCPLTDLQQWYSYSTVNTRQFMQLLDSATSLKPTQAGLLQTRLVAFRSTLGTLAIPPCAAAHSRLVFQLMDGTLAALENFAAGKQVDIAGLLTSAHAQYVVIQQNESQLEDILNALYAKQQGK